MPNYFGYNSELFDNPLVITFYKKKYVAKRLRYYRVSPKKPIPKNTFGATYLVGPGNTQSPKITTPPASEYLKSTKAKTAYLNAEVGRLVMQNYPWDTQLKLRFNYSKNIHELMTGFHGFQSWYSASGLNKQTGLDKWIKVLEHLRSNPFLYARTFFTWEEFAIVEKVITDAYGS